MGITGATTWVCEEQDMVSQQDFAFYERIRKQHHNNNASNDKFGSSSQHHNNNASKAAHSSVASLVQLQM
ncbi:hypothetical protein COLO4_23651 [Corchorus olitorius]|uniref:Uncharacterized protein n=1 Tax=Corchorus olitorius TaxID=93759 RepID=A0A1R3IFG8_9ROSI|nr:hypothetical protein COLO4_23651 [Corchorus olitorius]